VSVWLPASLGQFLFMTIHTSWAIIIYYNTYIFGPIFIGMRGVQTLITSMTKNDDKSIGG
jgi:hypothetical protein